MRAPTGSGRQQAGASATSRAVPAAAVGRPLSQRRARVLDVRNDAAAPSVEVRVCTGKTCKKQGSEQIFRFGRDLGLPGIEVVAGGCLGNCGNGPNLVLLPAREGGEPAVLRHVATPADLAEALRAFCGANVGVDVLRATELRLAGNALALEGDLEGAIERYQSALEASPGAPSAYLVLSNLSAACLQLGRREEALEHARLAAAGAPKGFHKAHVRLIDALWALGQFSAAGAALAEAVALDTSFASTPEYKVITRALKDAKLSART